MSSKTLQEINTFSGEPLPSDKKRSDRFWVYIADKLNKLALIVLTAVISDDAKVVVQTLINLFN